MSYREIKLYVRWIYLTCLSNQVWTDVRLGVALFFTLLNLHHILYSRFPSGFIGRTGSEISPFSVVPLSIREKY